MKQKWERSEQKSVSSNNEESCKKKGKRYLYDRAKYTLGRIDEYIASHSPESSDTDYGSEDTLEVCIMRDARNVISDTFSPLPLFKGLRNIDYYYGDKVRYYIGNGGTFVDGIITFDDSDKITIELPDGRFTSFEENDLMNLDREPIYFADSVACYVGDTVVLKTNHIIVDGKPLKGTIDINNDKNVVITCVLSKVCGEEIRYTLSKHDDGLVQKIIK